MQLEDKELLARIIVLANSKSKSLFITKAKGLKIELEKFIYPLDGEVLESIRKLSEFVQINNNIYQKASDIKSLWAKLIEKAIICLRYFDTREPFIDNPAKKPIAYGIDELIDYYKSYDEFESLLYGSNKFYRDHLIHAFKTWLIGIYLMIDNSVCCPNGMQEDRIFIEDINFEGMDRERAKPEQKDGKTEEVKMEIEINLFEKISMWTIIALCHDLGYPLEKSQQIINKTNKMMNYFIPNPRIWSDISFSGIQDNINDYIIKFMSSKMVKKENTGMYVGRIQPKYYIKHTKSLERYNHGIISAIILYKMLLYFIEADFNMNEDYLFKAEDARQFYIRREILRSITAHTCGDIYHMQLTTFPALLINCDELQEWGRKKWDDFYSGIDNEKTIIEIRTFSSEGININQNMEVNIDLRDNVIKSLDKQFDYYTKIFRDGQDTGNRNFNFQKNFGLKCKGKPGIEDQVLNIVFTIEKDKAAEFIINTSEITNGPKRTEVIEEMNKLKINLKKSDSIIIS